MQEKDGKKKEKQSLMEKPLSRRDFSRIAMTFGATSTLFAWQSFADAGMKPDAHMLAQKAKNIQDERYKAKPKYKFRYGAAGHSVDTMWVAKIGTMDFVREVEERTDGEIRIEPRHPGHDYLILYFLVVELDGSSIRFCCVVTDLFWDRT